jgi:hypothetical protein
MGGHGVTLPAWQVTRPTVGEALVNRGQAAGGLSAGGGRHQSNSGMVQAWSASPAAMAGVRSRQRQPLHMHSDSLSRVGECFFDGGTDREATGQGGTVTFQALPSGSGARTTV